MAARYWIGGTGNWSDSAHWSAASGGAGGASIPGLVPGMNYVFDGNSGGGICTMDVPMTDTFAGACALQVNNTTEVHLGSDIEMSGNFIVWGGSFYTENYDITVTSAANLNFSTGTATARAFYGGTSTLTIPGSLTFGLATAAQNMTLDVADTTFVCGFTGYKQFDLGEGTDGTGVVEIGSIISTPASGDGGCNIKGDATDVTIHEIYSVGTTGGWQEFSFASLTDTDVEIDRFTQAAGAAGGGLTGVAGQTLVSTSGLNLFVNTAVTECDVTGGATWWQGSGTTLDGNSTGWSGTGVSNFTALHPIGAVGGDAPSRRR